mgnify:CR=1 FL=1|jgi:hypothetical protein
MTKILIVSDNHGLVKELENIYFRHKVDTEYFIHCGDSELTVNHPILEPYECVKGNCDFHQFPKEYFFQVEGKNILVLHGHYHNIKYGYDMLYHYALERNCDFVFYGHTHFPSVNQYHEIVFINPGSILANRGIRGRSYALLELNGDSFKVKFYDVVTGLALK